MIIKSLGRKGSGSFTALSDYILREDAVYKNPDGSPYMVAHNVFGNLEEIRKQIEANENLRINKRANNNTTVHTILSFAREDADKLTPEKLDRIAREYIERLNPDSLAIASFHISNGQNPHIHILQAGCVNGHALRVDRSTFAQLKNDMELWQATEFPELTASEIQHNQGNSQNQDEERHLKESEKERIRNLAQASFSMSQNRQEFVSLLAEEGLGVYERNGQITGISGDRNYRLSTLNIDLAELDIREQRMQEIQVVENNERNQPENSPESKGQEKEEFTEEREDELSEEERKRMDELDEMLER